MTMHSAVVRYEVPGFSERWILSEEPVPESAWHDACAELLKALLVAWNARTARAAAVYRNLAIRVRSDRPQLGFDPDLCLIEPAPSEGTELDSLKLWQPGHRAPALAVEVVSPNHPTKDYSEVPEKCAAAGVGELVVFDPKLAGPRAGGGPHLLQIWRRAERDNFVRVHASSAAGYSPLLGAWWTPLQGGQRLGIADDAGGTKTWLTVEQAALQRVAELEAALAERRGG
jgi:Uma2 family endonuclease